MGNRANVVFKQENGYLGLYLHNAKHDNKASVANSIQRVIDAGRTKDLGYGTRIAVSQMIGNDWSQDYSYGLYVGTTINEALGDNEHDVIVVDFENDSVKVHKFDYTKWAVEDIASELSLTEFVKQYK